ncbi:MAG TPA: twin-arginine translocase TatA/TatE family subunit [Actinomycetota bacterium]|nr:twin-arginine translocase TatA/TatE family subunit [Actinomycetota bacterium]
MLNFGPIKILFTAVAALLILGPKKIPDAVKGVTRALGELRKASKSVTEELKSGLELDDEASAGPPPVKTKASPKGPRALPPAEERRPGPRA